MAGVANSSKPQTAAARSNMPEMLRIYGTFTTNGATPAVLKGRGYTVTQVSTGVYRVTLNINTPHIVSTQAMLIKATTSATFLEIVDQTSSNNYVTFRITDATGAAAAPGAVGDAVSFVIGVMTVKLPVK